MAKKILIIAPHADDEVLGPGGYMLHQIEEGAKIYVAFGTIGGTSKRQVYKERVEEYNCVKSIIKIEKDYILYKDMDARMDTIPTLDVATKIEEILDEIKPDEVFLNYSSHHQDHKKLYDCAMIAFRLREGYNPKLIALYEYPFVMSQYDPIDGGRWYHDISDVIDKKIKAFYCYKSQVKEKPSPLNGEGIRALAAVRGLEIGTEYAEMFYIIKQLK